MERLCNVPVQYQQQLLLQLLFPQQDLNLGSKKVNEDNEAEVEKENMIEMILKE